MKQMFTIAVITLTVFAATPLSSLAESDSAAGRETLARALRAAWLPLESGLALSEREGTPLSAKYEIDDGVFQLSVYTWKVDALAGDLFAEVIVDYSTGSVANAKAITDGEDLTAAQAQKAAMAQAKRSLADVTANAVKANVGYRAVSAMPNVEGGRPVAEVTLVRGDDWKVVTERLD